MKIKGNPGPGRITVTFEEGKYQGKSVTMVADALVGGVALYANSIKGWDGTENNMDENTKEEVIALIKKELELFPPSEIIE